MFGQPEWSLRHEAIKYIYTKRMKEGTSVREHVLDMMMHFNISEVNGGAIDEANQVSFIFESLPKSFIPFQEKQGKLVLGKGFLRARSLSKLEMKKWLEEDTNISSALLMNILGKTIKTLRSDRGGEYMDLRFQDYLIEHGIQSQLSAPNTPQQNDVSEKRNQTLLDMCFETPYELWKGRKGNLYHFRIWGCPAHVGRVVRQLDRYLGLSEAQIIIPDDGIEDPLTYKQAMNDVDCDQWIKTMDLEMESMYSNYVWTLIDQPSEMDVKTTFLNGNLEESIYMVQSGGPGICYSVGIVSKYQSNLGRDHWITVKDILKYLRRIKDHMLVYGSKDLILTGYTDFDFQTNKDARKSTSGLVFTLNGGAVWAVANSREPRSHKRAKHIEQKYHLIREIVHQGDLIVTKISSEPNMADPFTKALTAKVFDSHLHGLGLRGL
ncbi:retrovirus-related pol polyprotein from transposon tnt 1-94 [Cucumis melo var. makuwa]|uniref:Retrovirus-related pol polyprotein from transposon tnt 1-94 n=1 Tax=Cucumis melo var. makuwa TaxID=1194695 RepID=A0A5A7T1L0_CUCMM|nr:retrovirus-related pol polyprotein from transposon tnt 1-94 [Cucumis melo var. makuwa]